METPCKQPDLRKWPDWLESIWAKSPVGTEEKGESLAQHTWEVLSRLRDLARLRPWLPQLSGFDGLWHVLFWAAFLHDWGKAARGFQAMLRGCGPWRQRHEVLSLAFVDWVSGCLPEESVNAVSAAIASHHIDADDLFQLYPSGLAPEEDPLVGLVGELDGGDLRSLWRWLNDAAWTWIAALGFDSLGVHFPARIPPVDEAVGRIEEEGVELIRKRIGSYRRFVRDLADGGCPSDDEWPSGGGQAPDGERRQDHGRPPGGGRPFWILPALLLRGLLIESDHVGSAHAGPLPGLDIKISNIFGAELGGKEPEESLYEHQRQALQAEGSAVLIAPTGSGKTEAALLWAKRQVEVGRIPRLFYTLPYQASMNAMYDRLNDGFPGCVGLAHSRSVLALYRRLMERDYEPQQAARQARWARNLAQLRYQPIQILSPYQVLKAAYQLKGYEAMLVDFAGSAFIFDEIHAYEPERLALILEFTTLLRERFGASFFVMSATMPSHIRRRVGEALGDPAVISASESLFRNFIRHELHLLEGELLSDDGLGKVADAFMRGNSVLVTCNTVARAQEAYTRLLAMIPPGAAVLVHSRFNGRDRLAKESEIRAATGLKSKERRPVIVVATQVVEVSLNIDLDMLFSDPAPLEALLQRFGRINRGRRVRNAPVYVFKEPSDGQGIYMPLIVVRALEVLARHADGRLVDESAVQAWLDEIYAGACVEEWERRYRKAAEDFKSAFLDDFKPFASNEALASMFDRLFDGTEVLPLCLRGAYESLDDTSPIESSQLLVPVSWRWMHMQKAKQVSPPDRWPLVVDVPYSPEYGLGLALG